MTNYEINWQAMAPGPYLSEKYQWSLDMSESDISCNSSPVGSNSMGSYQSSPTDSTWDYIPLVEKALGTMPMDELFPEPNLGNHQELLNYDYCDNPLASKNASTLPLDLIGDINNFTLPDTVDPMSNEDTTKFDLTQFLCDDNNQDTFEEKFSVNEHYQVEVTLQAMQEQLKDEEEEEPMKPLLVKEELAIKEEAIADSDTEIDVESVPEDYKPFFEPEEIDYQLHSKKRLKESVKKVTKKPNKPKFKRKGSTDVIHQISQAKTIPSITVSKKDVKQSMISTAVSIDSKKSVECKKPNVPYKSIPQIPVEKISPPAIIEASDAIGLLDQLEMFDMIKDEVKAKKPLAKQMPQRRTIAVEALPQSSKRSKVQKPKRGKELSMKTIEACQPKVTLPIVEEKETNQHIKTPYKIIVDTKKELGEKKKVNMQPIRTLKEIPVINPQDWLYTPQKSSTSSKPKPPIAKLKLVRTLPEGQSGQQISAAVLQQLQEKTKNKKIIVTQMLPVWKVEKPPKTNVPTKSVLRANPRSLVQISSSPNLKVPTRAVEISTQTDQPIDAKKLITRVPVVKREVPPAKKPGCWKVDHDYLNGASLVKPNYKPPMVSILKANVNKIKAIDHARIDYAPNQKIKIEVQEVQHKRKSVEDHQIQPKKVLKLEDYKQRKPIKHIIKQEVREEPIVEGLTLPPFVPPTSISVKTEPLESVKEEHPYVAPPPIPNHLQMMVSRGVNTSQSWAHLEQMAKNHGLQFSCNSLISSMLEQLPENDISDKIFEDVVVSFVEKKKEKVETCEIGVQVGTISINKRNRSQSPTPSLLGGYKSQGRWWGNRPRTFRDIIQSVMERRVVFVGGIREGTTNAQLASLFVRFGEIEHTNIIYEKKWQDGPDYCGFVTFKTADIAYEVIGKGNHYHGLEHFQLNFGGRRLFLQTPGYSDLDNMRDEMYVQQNYKESFSEALQVTRRLLKKQGKIS